MHKEPGGAFPRWMIGATVAVLLALGAGGVWFYRAQEAAAREQAKKNLTAIARLKADQIAAWRRERLQEGAELMERPLLIESLTGWLAKPTGDDPNEMLTELRVLQRHDHYADILVVDSQGRVRLSLNGEEQVCESYAPALACALHEGRPAFTELHTGLREGSPHIALVVPLSARGEPAAGLPGAIVLVNDASRFLYPLIESWPAYSRTAETVLVARDDGDALFLNNTRHRPDSALKLRIALDRTDEPAVMAVLGREGFVQGTDYRGVQTAAVVLPVPDTPWCLVAKMDQDEVFAGWRVRAALILGLTAGLMGMVLSLGFFAWQRNQKAHYRALYRVEAGLRRSMERHRITLQAVGDAVIATDCRGRVELMNPVAEGLTGRTQEEAVGRRIEEVFCVINEKTREKVEIPVERVLREKEVVELANHTLLISRDGREIPIADSAAPIREEDGQISGVVLVFRDQGEERRMQRLMQARLSLLEYAAEHSMDKVLTRVLDEVGLLVESPIGFYHFVDTDRRSLSLQQWSSRTVGEFCRAEVMERHYEIDRAGVWADCVREGRPVVHNDYASLAHRKGMPVGHAEVVRELVVPVMREGRPVAVLGVGNKPSDYTEKDVETVSYLADVTWQIVEQKRAEAQIRLHHRMVVSSLNEIYMFDAESLRFLDVNLGARKNLGYTLEELRGMTPLDLKPEFTADSFSELIRPLRAGAESRIRFNTDHRRKDGSLYPVEVHLQLMDGESPVFVAFILDITERKKAEEKLRESERLFKDLFERHAAVKLIIDPDTGNIIDANHAAADFYGWSREQLKRMSIQQINTLSPGEVKQEMEKVRNRIRVQFEFRHRQADGSIRDVAVYSSRIESGGKDLLHSIVHDITERKQAEKALVESENRYRNLIMHSPDAIFVDYQDCVVLVNHACVKLFGAASEDDLVGKSPYDLFHRDFHEQIAERIHRLENLGEPVPPLEERIVRMDGRTVDVEVLAAPFAFADGNASHVILHDITTRKRMERVQIRRSRRTQTLLDLFEMSDRPTSEIVASAIDALVGLTESRIGFLGFVDESESTMFTHLYSKQAMQECAIDDRPVQFDLSGGGLWTAAVKLHEPVIINDYSDAHPFKKGFPEGHVRLTRYLGVPLVRDGRTLLLAGLANKEDEYREEDLVEATLFLEGLWGILWRRQTETALQESLERFRLANRATSNVIWDWDFETDVHWWNDNFQMVFGYEGDEIGRGIESWIGRIHPADCERVTEGIFSAVVSHAESWSDQYRFRRRDGSYAFVADRGYISRDADGKPLRMIGAIEDISDRKQAEEQLLQVQKLESVGRLAGGVAHDFNNMLGVIIGYAELGLKKIEPDHPLRTDIDEILKAANRSANITRQLLAFARKQAIKPVVLSLNHTVEGMLKMIRRLIGEDIDLAWLPRTALWPVRMDPSQLDQVLANLCVNARDAIHGVGKITIETDRVVFDETYCADHPDFVPGRYVMLAVSDDGCGMDRETLDRIFEPFFTTKEVGRGTGLGLSTVHGIVRQNGGFIHVYSEPGKGTTFRIYLPSCEDEVKEIQVASDGEMPLGQGETLMVAEDDELILNMVRMMLDRLGYTVLTAGTATEAIRLAKEHPGEIRLLITDVVMPEMNGLDLVDRCQAVRPGMKCLFMSGYTAEVIAHQGMLNDPVPFIQKPFSMEDLAVKVCEMLKD